VVGRTKLPVSGNAEAKAVLVGGRIVAWFPAVGRKLWCAVDTVWSGGRTADCCHSQRESWNASLACNGHRIYPIIAPKRLTYDNVLLSPTNSALPHFSWDSMAPPKV